MHKLIIFLLFTTHIFSQSSPTLEDKIYNAVDVFIAKPNAESLKKLDAFVLNSKPKTNLELLAFVVLNCNKAYYENQFGQTKKAVSSYEKAWQIYQKQKLTDYDITEYCLKPLGNLYTILGDYDNAENTIKQYYFLATKAKNKTNMTASIINLSNVYQSSGRSLLAIELVEKTLQTQKLSNIQKGILFNNLGANYILSSNFDKAKKAIQTSIQLLQKDKNQSENLSNAYRNLSNIYANENNFTQANVYYDKAYKLFFETKNNEPRKIAKLDFDYALLFFKEQNYMESSLKVSQVFSDLIPNYDNRKNILPNANSLYAETILLDALDLQAEIFLAQNQPKKALETYSLASHIEDLFAKILIYENSKIITQIRVRNRTEKCIAVYKSLFENEKNNRYIELAFQLSEKTKSGVLKKQLLDSKTASAEERLLSNQLQNLNNEIIKEQQKGDLASISKINDCIQKQNEVMLSLKGLNSKNTALAPENIDLKSLFSKLEKDNAQLICYFSGIKNHFTFTLINQKITLKSFSNDTNSAQKTERFLDYFNTPDAIANDVLGYQKSANLVYKMFQLPKKSTCKNLVIIPDGLLNFLPFEALITQESNTINFAKMHYLSNDFQIAYNNSAQFYLDSKPISGDKNTVLGIFPVFEKTKYALTFSKEELKNIKTNFEGTFFENANATFSNFKKNANHYSILHLSTHASAGDTQTPASIKFYDQEILYSELYNLHINPNLVVLSACETGIGKLYKSEGAMSVARGFQYAGAQNLLFSLWKVNDYTTSVFMTHFYRNVKNNDSFFEANAKAKQNFLEDKTIPNAKKSPYYWSAFVYYGTLEKNQNSNYWIYFLSGIGIIGLFLLFFKLRKKHKKE
jgi:CHAT domain-containing protein/tetratricopeptide (TPR) repeat protein